MKLNFFKFSKFKTFIIIFGLCCSIKILSLYRKYQPAKFQIIDLVIENHKFNPEIIEAYSGSKIKLIIHNKDDTPEEFESIKLNREKIIPGKSKATVILPNLKPGEYDFFGEFHDSARGRLIIKD